MTINQSSLPESLETNNSTQLPFTVHSIDSENPIIDSTNIPNGDFYRSIREPLWNIHEFVRQVLAKESPGFRVLVSKNGNKRIEPMALGNRFYRLMNNYMGRIASSCQTEPAGFVGLFLDCCVELALFYNPFGKPGDYHRPGINGAELFNALLELIRKRARSDRRCKDFLNFSEDYDLVELKGVAEYFDDLFVDFSKILVVRVDLGYQADEAEKISFEQAHSHIQRFINNRHWHHFFDHCIGYVIARERGTGSDLENGDNGRGYHFHCFILFDGQKEKNGVELAKKVIDYWENRIVNSPRTPADERIKTWYCNCNARESNYRYNGIGMVSHADELKRWHMIFAMIYLTKNSQGLGDDVPPGTRALTKGQYKSRELEKRGRPRQFVIQGEKVSLRKGVHPTGDFLQPGHPSFFTPDLNTPIGVNRFF